MCLSLNCFGNPNPVFPGSDATETSTFSHYNGLYSIFIDILKKYMIKLCFMVGVSKQLDTTLFDLYRRVEVQT